MFPTVPLNEGAKLVYDPLPDRVVSPVIFTVATGFPAYPVKSSIFT